MDAEAAIKDLTFRLDVLEGNLEDLRKENAALKKQHEEDLKTIEKLQKENRNLHDQVDYLTKKLYVYMKDDRNTIYDIEMQTTLLPELPKRTRYYQGMIDVESLERSANYQRLPNSYVIFISLYNPFPEYGLHKYTFTSTCDENGSLKLNDGAKRIFLSAEGTANDVSDDLSDFLHYLVDQSTHSELTRKLEMAVQKAKTRRDWSVEYMTLYEMKELEREEGRKEGKKDGKILGMIQVYYNDLHLTPEEIASKIGKSVEEVNKMIAELKNS